MNEAHVVETEGLTKEYGSTTALVDCSIEVPRGAISALVGPNGAGKTTLLQILAGLREPTRGDAHVFGRAPAQNQEFLADIGFLAQDIPMFKQFSAEQHIGIGQHLNPRWDGASARARISSLDIPLTQRVGTMSGGQRAQVALALALAKRPRLLLLDEPVAALDPYARRQFLSLLAEAVADGDLTVLLSSHLVNDLERVCDHMILLAASRPQLCGDIDVILGEHKILVGPRRDTSVLEGNHDVIEIQHTPRQTTVLVRVRGPIVDPNWEVHDVRLEELVIAYMSRAASGATSELRSVGAIR